MNVDWCDQTQEVDARERADALYRVANLTSRERTFVLELAETGDHQIIREGKLLKTHESLEEKGWLRITTDDIHPDFAAIHTIGFTIDGWDALNVLLDQRGE